MKDTMPMAERRAGTARLLSAGALIGLAAVILQARGSPPNMGLCVGCFLRDIAGAIGWHRFEGGQFLRPEIPGILFGAMAAALGSGQWRSRGGAAPFLQFLLGAFAMVGTLVFLGCPWRALLRLGGGDLNGGTGLLGLAAGVWVVGRLRRAAGESADRPAAASAAAGLAFPAFMGLLLALAVFQADFGPGLALFQSRSGPGAMRPPLGWSLGVGFAVGLIAQRSRFCLVGAFRNAFFAGRVRMLLGVCALVLVVLAGNLLRGGFRAGFSGMPLSHDAHAWNFAAMFLCGLVFSLAGGCPMRQVVRSAEGDGDAAVFCAGMLAGVGMCHNWNLVSVPSSAGAPGGPTAPAIAAVAAGIVFCLALALARPPARPGRSTK